VSNVPTNLIPSRVTQLPEYFGSSTLGYMPYVVDGRTYKVQFTNIAAVGAVPSSRTITTGTGLTGGGDLSQDRVISITNGGVGQAQLSLTGVVAGTYGSGSAVPVVTVDDTGRVTSVTASSLSIAGYVPDSRLVSAGAGLIGGGPLLSDVTLSVSFSSSTPEPLGTASAGAAVVASREDHVHPAVDLSDASQTQGALPLGRGGTGDALSPIAGAVVYSDATHFVLTAVGTAGQVLTSDGVNAPYWSTVAGTVTSVAASGGATGLTFSGSPITTSGTLTLGGTLGVASGGTGATTAPTARANLGAAASGANSDITSLSGITGGISTADYVAFDTTNAVPPSTGRLAWNVDDGTLDVGLNGGSVLQVGQETLYFAKNTSGGSIANGAPVMFTGALGASGKLTFGLAVADGSVPAEYMMGVATQTVADNGFGYVTDFGLVRGFDTSGTPYGETWADGDLLYFDPAAAGTWTNVEPAAPNIHLPVAVVVNATSGGSGSIFVRMSVSQRLGELQDVYINGTGTPLAGQTLIYDATQSRWENHTLTAGSGISITNGDGSITIAATGGGGGSGTVTSVAATVPTGFTISGSPITTSGTLVIGFDTGYALPTTAKQAEWDTAYADRLKWDGGATGLTASTGRASLGATTVGSNIFTLINPSAVTFLRLNADNTVSALDAATFRAAIGAGTGAGTVTSVAATAGTGISVTGSPITSSGTLTITNTAPDQIVSLTGVGTTAVTGTYPNFTITSNDQYVGTVTSVGGTGTVNGITLTGTVTSSGSLTLGGTLSGVNLTTQVTGTLPVANGGTGATTLTGVVIGNGTSAFTTVTAPSGAIVGTTDTQTLSGKTLNSVILNDGYTEEVFAVTGTTPALSPSNGSIQTWTLTASSTPTAGTWAAGQSMTLMIDDGTAYTVTWTSLAVTWKTDAGVAPTLNLTGFTVIQLWKVGSVIYGARVGNA
jgi:hypothetical protein